MKLKSSFFVLLLFCLLIFSVQNVDVADANFLPLPEHYSGVFIRSDGRVEPLDSPIQKMGDVYTLTGPVSVGIAVEKSNVVINGNGNTLQGNGTGTAFYLQTVENVTIQNVTVQGFHYGFYLHHSNRSTIKGNNVSECGTGFEVTQASCYNRILGNTGSTGISIYVYSNHNIIAGNDVPTISVVCSDYVTIEDNTVASNTNLNSSGSPSGSQNYGVDLDNSNHGKLYNNIIERNMYGIHFWHCLNFTLSGNILQDNDCGIRFEASSSIEYRLHTIDASNTINGKPIYYLVNQHDVQVPSNAGWVAAVNCTNITVQNVAPAPNGDGILFAYTKDSRIINSTLAKSFNALMLDSSSNCSVSRNLLCNSGYAAIYFDETVDCTVTENVILDNYCIFGMRHDSKQNKIFRNNFIDNGWMGAFDDGVNIWDNGSEGNYWNSYDEKASYSGVDTDKDGIGDTPYVIDVYSGNVDNYPLMNKVNLPTVLPEFSSWIVLLLLLVTFVVALVVYKQKLSKN